MLCHSEPPQVDFLQPLAQIEGRISRRWLALWLWARRSVGSLARASSGDRWSHPSIGSPLLAGHGLACSESGWIILSPPAFSLLPVGIGGQRDLLFLWMRLTVPARPGGHRAGRGRSGGTPPCAPTSQRTTAVQRSATPLPAGERRPHNDNHNSAGKPRWPSSTAAASFTTVS